MKIYLSDTEYAMTNLFEIVNIQIRELKKLQDNINDILRRNDIPTPDDIEPEGVFLKREGLLSLRREQEIRILQRNFEDKEYSIQCIYGAILQIAKQGLSTVYGSQRHRLMKDSLSGILVEEIIFEARNQAMHFEENNFSKRVEECFESLKVVYGSDFDITNGKNKAKEVVLKVLEWQNHSDYEKMMLEIYDMNPIVR